MSTAGSSAGLPKFSETEIEDLEKTHLTALVLKGIIVFTEFENKIIFVPYEGLLKDWPLRKMINFPIDDDILAIEHRMSDFQLKLIPNHAGFNSRVFARVEIGELSSF